VAAVLGLSLVLFACVGSIASSPPTPRLSPPVISRPGVLSAVIDLGYPPFGGRVGGRPVGLDVDVASAIADRLGLRLEVVDARSTEASGMVQSGRTDLLFGTLTVQSAVASDVLFAGTYVSDAPAVFSAREASVGIGGLGNRRVAVQAGSQAYWLLLGEYGRRHLVVTRTLKIALTEAAEGQVDYAAGDALVGAYIGRDLFGLRYNGQLEAGGPLGVGVPPDKQALAAQVRSILDDMAAKGVLATLRRKWVGDLPILRVAAETSSSDAATASP
jgi:polar amino acid transport system substrate-binding protein